MNMWGGFTPSFMLQDRVSDTLPRRGQLSKKEYCRLLIEEHGVLPGTPDYMRMSAEFMPLEVNIGHVVGTNERAVWCPAEELNSHFGISGGSGAGKTNFVISATSEVVMQAIPVLMVDFHGDMHVPYMSNVLLSSGCESKVGLNPLDIEGLDPRKRGLFDHREAIVSMLKRAVPALSSKQRFLLSNALETAYVEVGIEDNNPRTWGRQPPTFATVSSILERWMHDPSLKAYRDSIGGCLASLGAIFVLNSAQN